MAFPIRDVRDEIDNYYFNFRERLRNFKGGKVSAKIVLDEWIKLPKDRLLRQPFCRKELLKCLELAKKNKELLDYAIDLPGEKGWLDKWQVQIKKTPRCKNGQTP